jgi:hypothetical protein
MTIRPAAISAIVSSTVLNGGCGATTRGCRVIFLDARASSQDQF